MDTPDSSRLPPTDDSFSARRSNTILFVALALMTVAFAGVMWQRNRIRSYWWASHLAASSSREAQAYYVACLTAVGPEALPATRGLARHERVEIRSLALAILGHLRADAVVDDVTRMLDDSDRDIRETAALTLAFSDSLRARAALLRICIASPEGATCAALSALARVPDPETITAICSALRQRVEPVVRAQAAESLAEAMSAAEPGDAPTSQSALACDPIDALVRALADRSPFEGLLATERQIEGVTSHLAHSTTAPIDSGSPSRSTRTVAGVAAAGLTHLTGHAIEPISMDDEAARDRFVVQCRKWISERRRASR